ncbi:MAG TPA: hypothetical protein VHV81_06025 [Steroidobacteraceae bacterium]|nr:hypothetical protein [Steroidobacteraceae bacterium]
MRRAREVRDPSALRAARACALLLSCWSGLACAGDWTLGAGAGVRRDSNVGNAEPYDDIVSDTIVGAHLSAAQLFPLGTGYSVTIGGNLAGEAYREITGLTNASADASIVLKHKWGLGAYAPWATVGVSAGRTSYDDPYRNTWDYHAALAAGRRFERWSVWGEYALDRRAARDQEQEVPGISGDAFSAIGRTLSAHAEYSLSGRVFLTLSLSARRGDVISTTEENLQVFYASRAIAEDPAFGEDYYAYKITGNTYGAAAGLEFALSPHNALSLGFARFETRAYGGNDYDKSIPEITWSYSF